MALSKLCAALCMAAIGFAACGSEDEPQTTSGSAEINSATEFDPATVDELETVIPDVLTDRRLSPGQRTCTAKKLAEDLPPDELEAFLDSSPPEAVVETADEAAGICISEQP